MQDLVIEYSALLEILWEETEEAEGKGQAEAKEVSEV